MSATHTPGMGHNQPPEPILPEPINLDELLDPELLAEQFAMDYSAQLKRRDELLAGVARFLEAHPQIEDEAIASKATDFGKSLKAAADAAEAERVKIGRKFILATRAVQDFFAAAWKTPLDEGKKKVEAKLTIYQRAKDQREREARAAESRRLQEEAARLAREAEASMQAAQLEQAGKAAEMAETAQRKVEAKPAEFSRVRGDSGATASLRRRWVYEVTDLADVPTEYLVLDEKKVSAAIAAGEREIPGLRIFEDTQARIR